MYESGGKGLANEVKELVKKAQNGDADAFGKLYGLYYKEMYSYACCVTGNAFAAEDAVSDAVCSAFKQIKSLRNADSFKGWLFRILNISCRNQFKSLNSHISLDDTLETGRHDDGGIENLELSLELQNAVKILTAEEREIVFLKILGEYKSREIAEILDLPHATVRSKLARALAKLRDELENN
jgi:RNA polymerase sigma-70 factor, ECF subfamily